MKLFTLSTFNAAQQSNIFFFLSCPMNWAVQLHLSFISHGRSRCCRDWWRCFENQCIHRIKVFWKRKENGCCILVIIGVREQIYSHMFASYFFMQSIIYIHSPLDNAIWRASNFYSGWMCVLWLTDLERMRALWRDHNSCPTRWWHYAHFLILSSAHTHLREMLLQMKHEAK